MSDRTKKPKPFRYPREVDADELAALEAKAAKFDIITEAASKVVDVGGDTRLHIIWSPPLVHLAPCDDADDARRWRTVERAVEKNEGTLMLFQERSAHPDQRFVIGTMGRFSSGHYETEARESTLAAAVDSLQERMDKEAI